MPQLAIIVTLLVAIALQFLTGNFPVAFFAFPLNLILALLWAGLMFWLWKARRKSFFVTYMISKQATIVSIAGMLLYCMVIGFSGKRDLVNTWIFVFIFFFFQTTLMFVLFRGLRQFIHHIGLLIVVASAFWGAPDSDTLRFKADRDVPVRVVF